MTINDMIDRLDECDAGQTIYATDNSPTAMAVVDFEPDDGTLPASAMGMKYLLEVSLARDAIRVWSEWRNGRQPMLDEKTQAVLYYAEHDAFMPTA